MDAPAIPERIADHATAHTPPLVRGRSDQLSAEGKCALDDGIDVVNLDEQPRRCCTYGSRLWPDDVRFWKLVQYHDLRPTDVQHGVTDPVPVHDAPELAGAEHLRVEGNGLLGVAHHQQHLHDRLTARHDRRLAR